MENKTWPSHHAQLAHQGLCEVKNGKGLLEKGIFVR